MLVLRKTEKGWYKPHMKYDITPYIENTKKIIERHNLGESGAYSRWIWQPEDETKARRKLGLNEYGCADAANILYMIGAFPSEANEREKWVMTLQQFQHPEDGLFVEETHHPFHTTAHCIAALELFEQKAQYPLVGMHPYLEKEKLYSLLDHLEWTQNPWLASHKGAGLYAALVLQGEADGQWQQDYFDWFWQEADPETGFWRKGNIVLIHEGDSFSGKLPFPTIFPHLAGSFHYLFNHEYAHMPLHYPEKLIDTCLKILDQNLWVNLGQKVSFAEVDWVYCLTRAMRQTPYRFSEGKEALRRFAARYISYLDSLDPMTDDGLNDLHTLFGSVCALAELQSALPGEIHSEKPLKLVLDRRPFI